MQKIIKSKYFWLLLGQLLIISASLLNTFPKGYIFSAGDIVQYFNFPKVIKTLSYIWDPGGQGGFLQNFSYNIFYYPFLLLSNFLRLSPSNQSFLYYFIFLLGSFWSFYFGLKLYKKDIDIKYHIFFSFLYSFNVYVFNNFLYTWGYSPFPFLYVLIPLIFGLTYNFFALQNKINFKTLSLLGLVFFLTNIPNGNMPFFISLNIFLFLFLILLFIFICGKTIDKINFLKKTFFYYAIYYFAVFWSVVPQITELLKISKMFNNNETFFNIGDWIISQAAKFPYPFFFNFDINNFSFLGYFSLFLFLVLLLSIIFGKKQKDILVTIYLFLLLVCIFLLNKGNGILNREVILKIFAGNPVLASLRSVDKTVIFLPFFVLISTFLDFEKISSKNKVIFVFLLTLSLLSVYPFFTGGIQTKYSIGFKKGENYLSAEYSYLHKIPDEYSKAAEFINNKNIDVKILRVPYNVINSVGWVNFPKWKQVGIDPTVQLFNNPTIEMNSAGPFGRWNYGGFWNTQIPEESRWILPITGLLNTGYLMYHKDVDPKFLRQTISKIEFYEEKNFIEVIDKNDYFNLYKINSDYFLPHFYIPKNIIYANEGVKQLVDIVGFRDYQIKSAIYLAAETLEINRNKEILNRADEVFVKGERENAIKEEDLGLPSFEVALPYVRQKPGSLFYSLVLKKEKYDKWKVREETEKIFEKHLFYASKRISEIMAFGVNELVLASYKKEMTDTLGILKKLKQEGNKDFVKLLAKYEGTLWGHRNKINELTNYSLTDWDNTFKELEGQAEELKIKQDFSKLAYKFEIPKSGNYSLFIKDINGLTDYSLLGERNFEEGEQELVLPFSGINENLVDENLRIKDYSPNSIYRISFDYQAPRGGSFFVAEGKTGETAETQLSPTGDEFRNFEMFFKSSLDVQEAAVHLSISVSEEKNLRIERIYQPEVVLKNIQYPISNIQYQIPKITFVKINPTKYRVKVEGAKEPYTLVFSESFHQGWKLYINGYTVDTNRYMSRPNVGTIYGDIVASYFDGEIKEGTHKNIFLDKNTFETWGKKPLPEERHLLINGYANSWYVTPEDSAGREDYEVIIEFQPQRLFYIGLGISILTLVGCLGYLGYSFIRKMQPRREI